MKDPRFKNQLLNRDVERVGDFLKSYVEALTQALETVSAEQLDRVVALLIASLNNGNTIFVAGNGGSAAISDHLCCDWCKGTRVEGRKSLHVHSLSSNFALISAIGNDYGFEDVFSTQLEMFAKKGDALVLISSSGNSPNILKALRKAKELGVDTVGFSGFSGGELAKNADINLHVNFPNYGVVEDSHQILMHVLAQFLAGLRDQPGSSL
jgi:D-sedoheptulose 7-phosphate isomerase